MVPLSGAAGAHGVEQAADLEHGPFLVGKVVADSFYSSCADVWSEDSATFSITDLSKIDALIEAVNNAAASMNQAADDPSALASMVRGINSAKNYGGNNKSEGYTNMVDLGSLISSASTVAFNPFVAAERFSSRLS